MRITKSAHSQLHPRYSHQTEGKSLKIPPHTPTPFGGKSVQNIHRVLQIIARAAVLPTKNVHNATCKTGTIIELSTPVMSPRYTSTSPGKSPHPRTPGNTKRSDV
ncbi:hypothetical protein BRL53_10115 [Corynebacterium ulcerans]|nr:hypothetical protein BRL53_10115 [Corynebacterium ulcerans]